MPGPYTISVTQDDINNATQTDSNTSLMRAIKRDLSVTLAEQSELATIVNVDGIEYNEDLLTLSYQTIERATGVKPLAPYSGTLTEAS